MFPSPSAARFFCVSAAEATVEATFCRMSSTPPAALDGLASLDTLLDGRVEPPAATPLGVPPSVFVLVLGSAIAISSRSLLAGGKAVADRLGLRQVLAKRRQLLGGP